MDPGPESAAAVAEPRRTLRLTSVSGLLACALLLASYALPWIEVPEAERARVREAFRPGLDEMARDQPNVVEGWRDLVGRATDEGTLTGVDVFRYARLARALNHHLTGSPPPDSEAERPWKVQRALALGAIALASLPVVAALLIVVFALGRFRRTGTVPLVLLVLAGCLGTAMLIGWMRFTEGLGAEGYTGWGLRLALAATILQACIGLVGVDARNWWRVYTASIGAVAVLGVLGWAYVSKGAVL